MDFADLIDTIIYGVIDPLIAVIFALALIFFLWGVSKYILHGGDEVKRTEGYKMMVYGIVALFVMASVWAIVEILSNTFFTGGGSSGPIDINVSF